MVAYKCMQNNYKGFHLYEIYDNDNYDNDNRAWLLLNVQIVDLFTGAHMIQCMTVESFKGRSSVCI